MERMKLYLAGEWRDGSDTIEVRSPHDGRVVAEVARGGPDELEAAVEAAESAASGLALMTPAERCEILERAVESIRQRRDELAIAVSDQAGKPIVLAEVEADRCVDTFTEALHVARHPEVESVDLGGYASGRNRLGLIRRVPVGPVLAITPFNFPLNLVAHKLAPALAAGCPVVLKPASQTPGPALLLARILHECGMPAGALSVVPSRGTDAERLAVDGRFALVTFTGSMDVGWRLKELAWRRRVALELGGNAAVVVEPDIDDVDEVARKIAVAALGFAGQSCISVQRVLVHEGIYVTLRRALLEAFESVVTGDPSDRSVLCGPLVDEDNARRVEAWVAQAIEAGGRCLAGGTRHGCMVEPTLLEEVPPEQPVVADEVFGPLACLDPYEEFAQALLMVNDSRYGLQAGILTKDVAKVQEAWQSLEVGAVVHGDVPAWRTDPMPYGGVKGSGVGREGPRYAYREMTEERMLVLRR